MKNETHFFGYPEARAFPELENYENYIQLTNLKPLRDKAELQGQNIIRIFVFSPTEPYIYLELFPTTFQARGNLYKAPNVWMQMGGIPFQITKRLGYQDRHYHGFNVPDAVFPQAAPYTEEYRSTKLEAIRRGTKITHVTAGPFKSSSIKKAVQNALELGKAGEDHQEKSRDLRDGREVILETILDGEYNLFHNLAPLITSFSKSMEACGAQAIKLARASIPEEPEVNIEYENGVHIYSDKLEELLASGLLKTSLAKFRKLSCPTCGHKISTLDLHYIHDYRGKARNFSNGACENGHFAAAVLNAGPGKWVKDVSRNVSGAAGDDVSVHLSQNKMQIYTKLTQVYDEGVNKSKTRGASQKKVTRKTTGKKKTVNVKKKTSGKKITKKKVTGKKARKPAARSQGAG